MNKYLAYIFIIAKNTFSSKKKILFQMINHVVFMVFTFFLYKNVYLLTPGVQAKIPLPNAIWSMAMYFAVFWLALRNIQRKFREDVASGNVETYLLRPIDYVKQKLLIQIGEGLWPFFFAIISAIVVCYLLVGWPIINVNPVLYILSFILILFLSQILTAIIYIITGLTSFWLQDSEPVYFIVSKLIMLFGNAWVPVAFFPAGLRYFAEHSPFGASMAVSYAMYPDFMQRFPFWVGINILWIILLSLLMVIMTRQAYKKLAVNG